MGAASADSAGSRVLPVVSARHRLDREWSARRTQSRSADRAAQREWSSDRAERVPAGGTALRVDGAHRSLGVAAGHRLVAMAPGLGRSEEHTSELKSLMRISYAVFCLKKQK